MCLDGCNILVLPCTVLVVLLAITLGLLIEVDRQGVDIAGVTPWAASLRHASDRLGDFMRSPRDEEQILSLLTFLDSEPMCSTVAVDEIDSCAVWAGCMLASGMDNTNGETSERIDAVRAIRNSSPDWLQYAWKVSLCGKQFTHAENTWVVSTTPRSQIDTDQRNAEYRHASEADMYTRKAQIKEACMRAWRAYRKLAWGSDELLPVSRIGHRYRGDGLGMFLVSAMETLHLLGEQEAFEFAVAWVAGNSSSMPRTFGQALNIDSSGDSWPTSEVVAHIVGGLLTSYQLSGYEALLDAADSIAGRLEPAFRTNSGLPFQQCELAHGVCHRPESYPHNPRGDATVEETWAAGLELAIVAHVSHRVEHWRHGLGQMIVTASGRMLEAIDKRAASARNRLESSDDNEESLVKTHGVYARLMEDTEDVAAAYGLAGSLIDPDTGMWASDGRHTVAYGGRHGSSAERYYNGLLQQYIWWTAIASEVTPTNTAPVSGRSGITRETAARLAQQCKSRYLSAMEGLRRLLVRRSTGPHKLWYIGELLQGRQFVPAFSSSSCGLSGTLALGHIHGLDKDGSHLRLAKRIAESCVQISHLTASGLPPDVSWINGRPKADEDAVEWFIPERKGQQLQQMKLKAQEPESNETDLNARRSRMESGEIVVIRDESGSAAYTGSAVLAQSFYWLYRATNDTKYVEWGWDLFTALERSARLPREDAGYGTVSDVTSANSTQRDEMKSWLLMTFKWVWLLHQEVAQSEDISDASAQLRRRLVVPSGAGYLLELP